MNSAVDMFKSVCFWAPGCAWMMAQFAKMLCGFSRTKSFDLGYFVSLGGMPSAHSAFVCALATSVGLKEGFGSSVFVVSLAFAMIVMFDASTVRRAAGQQARILNEMIKELFKEQKLEHTKLVELLGHTRLEVFLGMLVGILTALIVVSLPAVLK